MQYSMSPKFVPKISSFPQVHNQPVERNGFLVVHKNFRLMVYLPTIMLGSQRLIWGKADMIPRNSISKMRKGITPRMMSPVGILKIVFTANKSTPIGGVMSPICVLTTNTTPNQMGSIPRLIIRGTKIVWSIT